MWDGRGTQGMEACVGCRMQGVGRECMESRVRCKAMVMCGFCNEVTHTNTRKTLTSHYRTRTDKRTQERTNTHESARARTHGRTRTSKDPGPSQGGASRRSEEVISRYRNGEQRAYQQAPWAHTHTHTRTQIPSKTHTVLDDSAAIW